MHHNGCIQVSGLHWSCRLSGWRIPRKSVSAEGPSKPTIPPVLTDLQVDNLQASTESAQGADFNEFSPSPHMHRYFFKLSFFRVLAFFTNANRIAAHKKQTFRETLPRVKIFRNSDLKNSVYVLTGRNLGKKLHGHPFSSPNWALSVYLALCWRECYDIWYWSICASCQDGGHFFLNTPFSKLPAYVWTRP